MFQNITGPFVIENIIPLLDKVQKRKSARLITGEIIIFFQQLLLSDLQRSIKSFQIFGGYVSSDNIRFSHYDRTTMYYNVFSLSGSIRRENSVPTYDGRNPFFSIDTSLNIDDTFLINNTFHISKSLAFSNSEKNVYFSELCDYNDFSDLKTGKNRRSFQYLF